MTKKTKEECLTALRNATRFGNLTSAELSNLTKAEVETYGQEMAAYYAGGTDDASRDQTQQNRLIQLATDLAGAQQ